MFFVITAKSIYKMYNMCTLKVPASKPTAKQKTKNTAYKHEESSPYATNVSNSG